MIDIAQYGGIWAMEPDAALTLLAYVREVGAEAHIAHVKAHKEVMQDQAVVAGDSGTPVSNSGDVVSIEIFGTMMKKASSFSDSASTVRIRRQVQNAARDPEIKSIILHIDSPGGTVAGTQDLANEVRNAAAKKPVYAFIEDLGASAAYWVASQATKIYSANDTTLIGSIGAYFGIYDMSKWAENNGIKPILFTTGKYKTIFPGTEVTEDQIKYLQSRVDAMQTHFTAAVQSGRSLNHEETKNVTEGKVYLAGDAVSLKLADGIRSFSEVVAEAGAAKIPSTTRVTGKAAVMPREGMATAAALKAALPNASAEFIVAQLEKEATVAESSAAWVTSMVAEINAKTLKLDEREKSLNEREAKVKEREDAIALTKGGATKLEQDADDESEIRGRSGKGDAEAKIETLVAERMEKTKEKREVALSAVLRAHPRLRQEWVAEATAKQRKREAALKGEADEDF